ncbi:MAG: signal peptidase I [Oscillospiraceae bacterium]|jgi:signal peptidase I|nr:signal peptidase I [Oscillospiraceae bacterium]
MQMTEPKKSKLLTIVYELADLTTGAFMVTLLLTTFVFRSIQVDGDSMLPTLTNGQRLLISMNNGLFGSVKPGDIVVVNQPSSYPPYQHSLIKRVIAIGGEEIDIDFEAGKVFVNGKLKEEKYVNAPTHLEEGTILPLTVPLGKVFVMGDNRNASADSRCYHIGPVDERYICGKVVCSLAPVGVVK